MCAQKDIFTPKNMKTKIKKPAKCCYPNCLECPYLDCRYDRLEAEDYTESNKRDYEMYEAYTGEKLHKSTDRDYQIARRTAYQRKHRKYVDRHEYNQKYYAEHSEEIKQNMRDKYDTKKNTVKCREYRKSHNEKCKAYEKSYYEIHKEEIKRKAKDRYYKKKLEKLEALRNITCNANE